MKLLFFCCILLKQINRKIYRLHYCVERWYNLSRIYEDTLREKGKSYESQSNSPLFKICSFNRVPLSCIFTDRRIYSLSLV